MIRPIAWVFDACSNREVKRYMRDKSEWRTTRWWRTKRCAAYAEWMWRRQQRQRRGGRKP